MQSMHYIVFAKVLLSVMLKLSNWYINTVYMQHKHSAWYMKKLVMDIACCMSWLKVTFHACTMIMAVSDYP